MEPTVTDLPTPLTDPVEPDPEPEPDFTAGDLPEPDEPA